MSGSSSRRKGMTKKGEPRRWLENLLTELPIGDACIIWPFARSAAGYGQIWHDGKVQYVTRLITDCPVGSVVRHSCDTPSCVNPAHLIVGSQSENTKDMWDRGRSTRKTILNSADVAIIRIMLDAGVKQRVIASMFGIHQVTVSEIKLGKIWRRDERIR